MPDDHGVILSNTGQHPEGVNRGSNPIREVDRQPQAQWRTIFSRRPMYGGQQEPMRRAGNTHPAPLPPPQIQNSRLIHNIPPARRQSIPDAPRQANWERCSLCNERVLLKDHTYHMRTVHYDRYYSTHWEEAKLGSTDDGEERACKYCWESEEDGVMRRLFFRGMVPLLVHIREDHLTQFSELVGEYEKMDIGLANNRLHQLLTTPIESVETAPNEHDLEIRDQAQGVHTDAVKRSSLTKRSFWYDPYDWKGLEGYYEATLTTEQKDKRANQLKNEIYERKDDFDFFEGKLTECPRCKRSFKETHPYWLTREERLWRKDHYYSCHFDAPATPLNYSPIRYTYRPLNEHYSTSTPDYTPSSPCYHGSDDDNKNGPIIVGRSPVDQHGGDGEAQESIDGSDDERPTSPSYTPNYEIPDRGQESRYNFGRREFDRVSRASNEDGDYQDDLEARSPPGSPSNVRQRMRSRSLEEQMGDGDDTEAQSKDDNEAGEDREDMEEMNDNQALSLPGSPLNASPPQEPSMERERSHTPSVGGEENDEGERVARGHMNRSASDDRIEGESDEEEEKDEREDSMDEDSEMAEIQEEDDNAQILSKTTEHSSTPVDSRRSATPRDDLSSVNGENEGSEMGETGTDMEDEEDSELSEDSEEDEVGVPKKNDVASEDEVEADALPLASRDSRLARYKENRSVVNKNLVEETFADPEMAKNTNILLSDFAHSLGKELDELKTENDILWQGIDKIDITPRDQAECEERSGGDDDRLRLLRLQSYFCKNNKKKNLEAVDMLIVRRNETSAPKAANALWRAKKRSPLLFFLAPDPTQLYLYLCSRAVPIAGGIREGVLSVVAACYLFDSLFDTDSAHLINFFYIGIDPVVDSVMKVGVKTPEVVKDALREAERLKENEKPSRKRKYQ